MALISTVCPECHETVKVDDSKPFGFCLSCGAKIAVNAPSVRASSGPSAMDIANNYIQLATSAKAAGNNAQCEAYCNKIIELDSTVSAAWALKASAVGWQSSLTNLRIEEMILYYSKAYSLATDFDQRAKIQKMALDDFTSTMAAVFSLQCDRFKKWPDAEEAAAFKKLDILLLQYSISFIQGLVESVDTDALSAQCGVMINNAVAEAEGNIIHEFANSNNSHPTDYDFTRYIERLGYTMTAYETAADMCKNDFADYPIIIRNMIRNHQNCINSNSWSYEYVGQYTGSIWWPHNTLSDEAVRYRQRQCQELENRISDAEKRKSDIEKQFKTECRDLYWQEHEEQKRSLEAERSSNQNEIAQLNNQLSHLEPTPEIKQLEAEISNLAQRRGTLGLFKLKEKKSLDEQIKQKDAEKAQAISNQRSPYEKKIDTLKRRNNSIDQELSKERPEYAEQAKTKPYTGTAIATVQTWVTHRTQVK